jgi:hypothetical protein
MRTITDFVSTAQDVDNDAQMRELQVLYEQMTTSFTQWETRYKEARTPASWERDVDEESARIIPRANIPNRSLRNKVQFVTLPQRLLFDPEVSAPILQYERNPHESRMFTSALSQPIQVASMSVSPSTVVTHTNMTNTTSSIVTTVSAITSSPVMSYPQPHLWSSFQPQPWAFPQSYPSYQPHAVPVMPTLSQPQVPHAIPMPTTGSGSAYAVPTPPDPLKRSYHTIMRFDGDNWPLFNAVFADEGRIFSWTPQEWKQQFLRRLTGKAAIQFAEHIGHLETMTWDEMYALAQKWYGKVHDRSYFQNKFDEQKREKNWTYSQFSTLLWSLATKGNPDWCQEVVEAVVFDRLRRYARLTDHLIYEAITRERASTVAELVRTADQWFTDYPGREPTYQAFWKPPPVQHKGRFSLYTTDVSPKSHRPKDCNKDRSGARSPRRKVDRQGVANEVSISDDNSRLSSSQCWMCKCEGHWANECPTATSEDRARFAYSRRSRGRGFRGAMRARSRYPNSLNSYAPPGSKPMTRDGGD